MILFTFRSLDAYVKEILCLNVEGKEFSYKLRGLEIKKDCAGEDQHKFTLSKMLYYALCYGPLIRKYRKQYRDKFPFRNKPINIKGISF
jgi:hypothetical protein